MSGHVSKNLVSLNTLGWTKRSIAHSEESNTSTTRYELLNLRHHRPHVRRPPTTMHRPGRVDLWIEWFYIPHVLFELNECIVIFILFFIIQIERRDQRCSGSSWGNI